VKAEMTETKKERTFIEKPLIVNRKDGSFLVRYHWGRFRIECDTSKYTVTQGLCDSGSTITIFITPKGEKLK